MSRRHLRQQRQEHKQASKWVVHLQAMARSQQAQAAHRALVAMTQSLDVVTLQASCRGSLARKRKKTQAKTISSLGKTSTSLQAACRGRLVQQRRADLARSWQAKPVQASVVGLQAILRRRLCRVQTKRREDELWQQEPAYTRLQAALRGFVVRKALRAQVQTLDDSADSIVRIQAAARRRLALGRRLQLSAVLTQTAPGVISLQSLARARLAKRTHADMQKALSKVEVASSVGGLQAFLRSRLAKKSTQEQKKQLQFVSPDVIGFQAQARGCLARREYLEWYEYLHDAETQAGITFLQRLLSGFAARRRLRLRLLHIYSNIAKVVTIQALWRGRQQRKRYQKIISGEQVTVATIQSFMHLLDDSENDFTEEIQVERLRKVVVDHIRANQLLENQVNELDTKIALILQNKLSFEELVKFKGLAGATPAAARESEAFHFAQTDPFGHGAHLEKATRHRLELYQQLFYMLQTEPRYLARMFHVVSQTVLPLQDRKMLEDAVLALYGYGQGRREDFLMHKLLQLAMHEEILNADLLELVESRPFVTSIALAYARPKQGGALKSIFAKGIQAVLKVPNLDLSTDPVAVSTPRFCADNAC